VWLDIFLNGREGGLIMGFDQGASCLLVKKQQQVIYCNRQTAAVNIAVLKFLFSINLPKPL